MDLRSYFKRIAEFEKDMEDRDQVVVSLATPDGGKAGVTTVVPKRVAAELMVLGRARVATEEEAAQFEMEQAAARRTWEEEQVAHRIQVQVVKELDRGAEKSRKS
jgi:hypothetical protein